LTEGVSSSTVGSYVLALWLDAPQAIQVGKLGAFEFPAGWYLYVGSARGTGGLAARLARHCRRLGPHKRARWHVDYLREQAVWAGAWGRTSDQRLECAWAAACRRLPGAVTVMPGFGASDCRCPAHLVYVPTLPGDAWFAEFMDARKLYVDDGELDGLLQTLTTGSEEGREAAALALGRFGEAAIEPLAALLARSDADIRWWTARALAEVGGCGAVSLLAGALVDADPDVRACAALALGQIGEGAAAPTLAARLADESAFVASIAADALSMLGEPAVETLVGMLSHDSPHVRLLSVRALGRIKSQHAIVPLFGVLEDDSYLVRHYAQEALEVLGVGMVFFAP
jgi:Uri superfamily endonuclease